MNNTMIWILIAGMALVTYLPRMLPAVLIDRLRFGPKMEKYLRLIPYTAMAALICPGVIFVDGSHVIIGLAGGLTAALLAWRKRAVMTCVLAAIAVDLIIYLIIL